MNPSVSNAWRDRTKVIPVVRQKRIVERFRYAVEEDGLGFAKETTDQHTVVQQRLDVEALLGIVNNRYVLGKVRDGLRFQTDVF